MKKSDIKNRISNWVLLRAVLLAIFSVQLGSLAEPTGRNQIATSYITSGKTLSNCTKEQRKVFFCDLCGFWNTVITLGYCPGCTKDSLPPSVSLGYVQGRLVTEMRGASGCFDAETEASARGMIPGTPLGVKAVSKSKGSFCFTWQEESTACRF
jgi:hypothetical protein